MSLDKQVQRQAQGIEPAGDALAAVADPIAPLSGKGVPAGDRGHDVLAPPATCRTYASAVTAFEVPAEQGGEGQELGVVGAVAEPPEGLGAVPDRNGSTKPRNDVGLWPAGVHRAHGRDRAVVRDPSDRR